MGLVNNLVHLGKAAAMQGPWECCQCCQYPIPIPNPSTPFVYAKASTFAKATVDKMVDKPEDKTMDKLAIGNIGTGNILTPRLPMPG